MYLGGKGTRPCVAADNQITQVAYNYPGFQQTQLIMPYTPWFADSLVYALSRRADIGIRHDALGSKKHQERYREEIGNWVAQRWLEVLPIPPEQKQLLLAAADNQPAIALLKGVLVASH